MISASGAGYVRTLHVAIDAEHACTLYGVIPLSAHAYYDPYTARGARLIGGVDLESPAPAEAAAEADADAASAGASAPPPQLLLTPPQTTLPIHIRYARPRASPHVVGNYVDVPLYTSAAAVGVCAPGHAVAGWDAVPLERVVPRSHARLVPELQRALGGAPLVYTAGLGDVEARIPVGNAALQGPVAVLTLATALAAAAWLVRAVVRAALR